MRVEGEKELLQALAKYASDVQQRVKRETARAATAIHRHAVKSIQHGAKTGRVYERGPGRNLSKLHRASAPGEAPATDTGRLVSSMVVRFDSDSAVVGSTLREPPYPFYLEFGTLNMEARPFMRPALDAIGPKYLQALRDIHGEVTR